MPEESYCQGPDSQGSDIKIKGSMHIVLPGYLRMLQRLSGKHEQHGLA